MFSVRQKLFIARLLNRSLRLLRGLLGRDMHVRCRRRGINWDLDLNEGFDLSIYLLGAYEPRSLNAYRPLIRPGFVVFDIGANIGAHALHFAQLVGEHGRVYAFEPTRFALEKLRQNLALNPDLGRRMTFEQYFLVADRLVQPPADITSSWPVAELSGDPNEAHQGKPQPSAGATSVTADDFCASAGVTRIDFVKIDVDGHEYSVLRGFQHNLERFRPIILIEFAPFVFAGPNAGDFDEMVRFLAALDYDFVDTGNGRTLAQDPAMLRRNIVAGAGINALLTPRPRPASTG